MEIPGEIVSKGYINAMTPPQLALLAVAALLGLAGVVYFTLRKILPLLGILKNRLLVEEDGGEMAENKVGS